MGFLFPNTSPPRPRFCWSSLAEGAQARLPCTLLRNLKPTRLWRGLARSVKGVSRGSCFHSVSGSHLSPRKRFSYVPISHPVDSLELRAHVTTPMKRKIARGVLPLANTGDWPAYVGQPGCLHANGTVGYARARTLNASHTSWCIYMFLDASCSN